MTLGEVMGDHDSQQHDEASRPATSRPGEQSGQTEPGRAGAAGAQPAAQASPRARPVWRRPLAASLLGALGVTVISLVFIISFVGALHNPGPRSVPVGIVGTQTQASIFHKALDQQHPAGTS